MDLKIPLIERGIRQRCPLSAQLFLLANKIRINKEYGIEIELTEDKKKIYTDNTISRRRACCIQLVNEVEQFGRVSGLLNQEKAEGLW